MIRQGETREHAKYIPRIGVRRSVGMYTVDDVGFKEEGSVFVGTDEFVDHLRSRIAPDRMSCDL